MMLALTSLAVAQDVPPHTSVGTPQAGRIAPGGAELPLRGPGYHWLTNRNNPGARYGTPALVAALARAAAAVAERFPGSDLEIHDLSARGGGPIQGHGSHTSGRDVDIAYYATTPAGTRLDPTRSVWFTRTGLERGQLRAQAARFDAERNTLLLETLLADATIGVQYVFMEPGLQRLVRAHARRRPSSRAISSVLRTPRGRNVDPHADHLHVRIDCPAADVAHGCVR